MTTTETHSERSTLSNAMDMMRHGKVNVGDIERAASVVGGLAVAALGISRRSLPGMLVAGVGAALAYRGATGHCPLFSSLGINTATSNGEDGAAPEEYFDRGIHVEHSYMINKAPWELYQFWRNFENLPKFMKHLQSVKVVDETHSHWVASAPAGRSVEWDAEIINDEPNALIAWRSLAGADVDNAGSIRFLSGPEGRGTMVKVVIDYIPPAGRLGKWVATLFGEAPEQQIAEDLRRFKRLMETGEIATVEGQPQGSCMPG